MKCGLCFGMPASARYFGLAVMRQTTPRFVAGMNAGQRGFSRQTTDASTCGMTGPSQSSN
jgi:hypothetical protein